MDIAVSGLRSVLLGALGGLAALALAAWLGIAPTLPPSATARADAALQAVARRIEVSAVDATLPARETARRFIVDAAAASLYDAQAARLVRERSDDAAVQALAASVLREHETRWGALTALAQRHGVALPAAPSPEQSETLALLRAVAGPARERLFVRRVGVDAALAAIERFEATRAALGALGDGDGDGSLHGWIEQTLPALRERAALSQRLLPQVAERRPMA